MSTLRARAAETLLSQCPPGEGKSDIAVGLGVKAIKLRRDALFFRLVTYRSGRGSILITINSSAACATGARCGRRRALTTAILVRLLHRPHVINVKGRGHWLRNLEKTLGAPQNCENPLALYQNQNLIPRVR